MLIVFIPSAKKKSVDPALLSYSCLRRE